MNASQGRKVAHLPGSRALRSERVTAMCAMMAPAADGLQDMNLKGVT